MNSGNQPDAETTWPPPASRSAGRRLHRFILPFILALAALQPAFATTYINYDGVLTQLATGANSTPGVTGPFGVAVDLAGNLYVSDSGGNRIVKVAASGTTSVFAISGLSSPSTLFNPLGLAVDSVGNLYIADNGNSRIVKVSPAGSGSVISTGSFTLNHPHGVAVDTFGDLFIIDTGNSRIIEVPSSGPANASVVAPTSGLSFMSSNLSNPEAIAVDTYGNLYIADTGNNRLVEITTAGVGSAISSFNSESLSNPTGVAVSREGKIYIVDQMNARVATLDAFGNQVDFLQDDMNSAFASPAGIAVSATGEVYVTDASENLVNAFYEQSAGFGHVQLGTSGTPVTLTLNFTVGAPTLTGVSTYTAGSATTLDFTIAANGGTACAPTFTSGTCTVNVTFSPTAPGLRRGALVLSYATGSYTVPLWGIADAPVPALSPAVATAVSSGSTTTPNPFQSAIDGAGNLYVVSYAGSKIIKIPPGGGSGTTVSTGSLTLDNPTGIAIDGAGNLFISDYGNARIVEVPASGTASVLVINGISPNGALPALSFPTYLNFDAVGNLWITDYGNGRFVIVNPPPAGTGSTGDGTVANGVGSVAATGIYTFPGVDVTATALDAAGNFYIADRAPTSPTAPRVLKIDPFGLGTQVSLPSITLSNPQGITLDPNGNIYVLDSGHERIIQQVTNGTTSVMSFSGATIGAFAYGITADPSGNVYLSDFSNGRLLEINVGETELSFPATTINTQSSTLTATVTNLGDQNLAFSAISYTAYFKHDTTDLNSCTSTTSLDPGTSCDVPVIFAPTAVGPYSQYITFTTNALNTIPSIGYIGAEGEGGAPPAATTTAVTFSPTSPVYGQSVTITATVSSTSTPTGTVTFTDETTTSTLAPAVPLSSGVATTSTSSLVAGSYLIDASYSPAGNFSGSNGSNTLIIAKAGTSTALGLSGTTLTATVTAVAPGAGTPTGTVQFLNNSTVIGSGPLSGGIATLTVTPTPPYAFTSVYSGDSNFSGSTSNAVANTSIPTTTTVTASPSSTVYGQSLTFTATVASNSGTPTGTVTFTDLTTATTLASNMSLVSGVATAMASTLGPGSHSIQAVYSPSGSYLTSNGSRAVTIAKATTSTALVLSSGTLTATVTAVAPGAGTPTGSVQFLNGATSLGSGTVSGGIATLAVTATPPYFFTAVYSGDSNFSGSTSAAVSQSLIPTTTTVTVSLSSSVYGQSLTFTATVASNSGTPTGTVTFTDLTTATTLASNVSLVSGVAMATASALPTGSDNIQAVYSPSGSYLSSTGNRTVTINKANTSTALALSGGTLTATVTAVGPGAGTPTGTVQFLNGSTAIGNGTLSGGTATLTLTAAPPDSITAVYSGDTNFNTSTSPPVVSYPPGTSTLTLTGSPDPAQLGQPITFTANLITSGGAPSAAATGTVQFLDGTTLLGSSGVSGGRATYTTTALAAGSQTITATYSGNATFPSASAVMGLMVSAPITMNLTPAPAAPVYGQPVTLTATVGATSMSTGLAPPSGEVSWFLEGSTPFSPNTKLGTATLASGVATLNLSTLPVGHDYIQAQYSGDTMWPATVRQTELTISPAATTTSVSVAISSGQLMLTGAVSPQPPGAGAPTGNIQFVDTSNHNAVVASASLSGGKATAQVGSNVVTTVEGHAIAAVYSGDSNFSPSTSAPLPAVTNSAANVSATVAPDEIASLFGIPGLSGTSTGTVPLGTSLGGVSVNITDSTGTTRPALLYAVSGPPGQINLVIPSGTAAGPAVASITLPGGTVITTAINVVNTAPAVFTANETGQGVFSGQVTYVDADGSQTVVPSATLNDGTNSFTANPINLGAPGDQVYLVLYATGLRHGSSVTATVNGMAVPVTFFGAQPVNPGLDQVNLGPLPNSLAGAGQVNIVVTVDGQAANTVTATIQ